MICSGLPGFTETSLTNIFFLKLPLLVALVEMAKAIMINHFKTAKGIRLKAVFTDTLFSQLITGNNEETFKRAIRNISLYFTCQSPQQSTHLGSRCRDG